VGGISYFRLRSKFKFVPLRISGTLDEGLIRQKERGRLWFSPATGRGVRVICERRSDPTGKIIVRALWKSSGRGDCTSGGNLVALELTLDD